MILEKPHVLIKWNFGKRLLGIMADLILGAGISKDEVGILATFFSC